ncbi:MAG TPA: protein kinase [Bryobacteraceae bacterium]|nr:protein kinase [Bryobacteraceae bacterium]
MRLEPGSRLGPYEIVGSLGAGGMGEVYRARDSRLGREVALKVLPGEFSGDPGRRARFEQEARAAAALSHPNIVGLHDIGNVNGVNYFVGELVPGETLTEIIQLGPVPIRKLLDIAVQIADGMAAAHAARITHRDLKPANIMVTPEGRVKILDFGLAKQAPIPSGNPDDTVTVQHTTPGMILGTVHYMSPEQARGTPADHRSDQFSFGLILYEMATGKKAFDKSETIQTMAAILGENPPPIETPIPDPLRWAIDRCLAKQPADRYESTSDLYRDLRNMRDHLAGSSITTSTRPVAPLKPRRPRSPWRLWTAISVTAAAVFVAPFVFFTGQRFPDQSTYRFTPFAFSPGGQVSPVWSPDGKAVAYAARPGSETTGPFQVFVRYLDSSLPVQVTRIAEDTRPIAWAPDSRRILFRSRRAPAGIWSVSAVGGEPEPFMALEVQLTTTVAPDLKSVAYVARGEDGIISVWTSAPPGAPGQRYLPDPVASKALFNDVTLRFAPDGKQLLLFVKNEKSRDEVWLMPYPPSPSKPPKQVLAGLHSLSGTPTFSWMPDSRHIMLSFKPVPGAATQLWLADTRSDKLLALTSGSMGRYSPAVSPDGRKIVYSEQTGNHDIISVDVEHASVERLVATALNEEMPAWAANKPMLIYVTDRNGAPEIWLHNQDGTDRPLVTARDFPPDSTQWFLSPALSPEGDRVIYGRVDRQGRNQLWISSVSGGAPVQLTNDTVSAGEFQGSWSPDGAWYVYLATRDGKRDLLKVKTNGQAAPVVVKSGVHARELPSWSPAGDKILCGDELLAADGGLIRPFGDHGSLNYVFSRDGKRLYGLRTEGKRELLFSVDVATGAEKVIGDVGLESAPTGDFQPGFRFSLAPDGKSFVYEAGIIRSNLWLLEGFTEGLEGWGLPGR